MINQVLMMACQQLWKRRYLVLKNHQINLMINCSLGSTPETQMDSFVNHELIKSKDIFV
jgi:hypothetical protein